jgi:glycosyltransferase involved in cell wall biosynthesis
MDKGVSIIVPVYNEKDGLSAVLEQLNLAIKEWPYQAEVIVVDDGSSDNSASVAKKNGAKVIEHPRNFGYGSAIKSGILVSQYEYIITIDGDGSYQVEDIPKLVEGLDAYHLILGIRTGNYFRGSFLKNLLRLFYRFLVNYVAGEDVYDANTGLRGFRKDIAIQFLNNFCSGFSFSTTMTLVFILNGYFVGFVPIEYRSRVGKTKVKFLRDILRTSQILVSAIMLYNPIKVFLPLSVIVFLSGVIFLVRYIYAPFDINLLIFILLILSSMLFFVLGLIADLISQLGRR